MNWIEWIYRNQLTRNGISSVLLIVAILMGRWLVMRAVRRHERIPIEERLRWQVQARNAATLMILLGLVIIWSQELRIVAVSIVAFLVAIVVATKELIMCVSGGVLRNRGGAFSVGDRIEVKGIRGDVIDQTMLTTTLMEIGPTGLTQQYSGRAVILPNSVFLSEPVLNESFTQKIVLHVFVIPLAAEVPWREAERVVLEAAQKECGAMVEEARRHFQRVGEQAGMDTPNVEPRVRLALPEAGRTELVVRVPVRVREKGRVEQAILRRYLETFAASPGTGTLGKE